MSVTRDRITIYQIPEGRVRFVLAYGYGQRIMSDEAIAPGLYLRDPMRSSLSTEQMYLVPVDHKTRFCSYAVQVADAERFAKSFAPEDHLLPQDGRCFMGLNFSESDFPVVQDAVELACSECAELDVEGALTAICSEYVQRRNGDHLSCPSPRSELGVSGPAAGGFAKGGAL